VSKENKCTELSKFSKWLIGKIFNDSDDSRLGDFCELYNRYHIGKGVWQARIYFLLYVLMAIPPIIIRSTCSGKAMLKNYIKIAIRNMKRQKGFTFINLSALAMGMTCFILVLLNVRYEYNFDNFHKNRNEIYRVNSHNEWKNVIRETSFTQYPISIALRERFPEVSDATHLFPYSFTVGYENKLFRETNCCFTDQSFFNIFTFPVLSGDKSQLFIGPTSVVISERIARKYFGDQNPLGKILNFNNSVDLVVSAIIHIPDNSNFKYVIFVPFETLDSFGESLSGYESDWVSHNFNTFILVRQNHSHKEVEQKISDLIKEYKLNSKEILTLQKLSNIRLYMPDGTKRKSFSYAYILLIAGLFILLIACVNFMNLSTARYAKRSKEIGLRKTIGANRLKLIVQFFAESILFAFFAFLISIIIVKCFLPTFNLLVGKKLNLFIFSFQDLLLTLSIVFLTGIISGSYPALFLSSFQPLNILKGLKNKNMQLSRSFRKIFVIFQFTCAIILIIWTSIVNLQMGFIINKDLGFEKEDIAYIRLPGESRNSIEVLRKELLNNPGIINSTACMNLPIAVSRLGDVNWEGKSENETIAFAFTYTDNNYLNTFKIKLKTGRNFSGDYSIDKYNIILNEEAVRQMGIKSPIGKLIDTRLFDNREKSRIIGIVKDFHCRPLSEEIPPLIIAQKEGRANYCAIRIKPGNPTDIINYVSNVWKRINPNYPLELQFLNENYENKYNSAGQFEKTLFRFTLIAIFITYLGLIGLISFIAEQRTKEIGIRKTLGSSSSRIVFLLSNDFLKLVLLSNIIAWPVAYFTVNKWLENFAYKINVGIAVFILAGICSVIIAFITIFYQTVKAALSNPVNSLRYD
jgi:ABC-type antimicrobial peptide transport system permease subunit